MFNRKNLSLFEITGYQGRPTPDGGTFDWKRFFRLEISGYVCLLYTLLFTACLFVLLKQESRFDELDPGFWYKGPIAAIPVALVVGFIIHQVSITVLNPFCTHRNVFGDRAVLKALGERLRKLTDVDDAILKKVDKNGLFDALAGLPVNKNPSYSDYLRGEISRRYSFYYARIDAGVFAPVLGLVLSLLICSVLFLEKFPDSVPELAAGCWIRAGFLIAALTLTAVIFLGMFLYCSKLIREIDILECALLAENYDYWFVKNTLKAYEEGTANNT